MLRGKLVPKISLFFPPDLLFILNRSNNSPLYKLVLRLCKSTVNDSHCLSPSPGAPVCYLGPSTNARTLPKPSLI